MKSILGILAVVGSLHTASAAEVSGKVKLEGKPPAEKPIDVGATCGLKPKPITTRFYVTGADGGLGNVIVYLKNPPAKKYEAPAAVAELDQLDCQYQPYVMAVQAGQKMKIRNSDPFLHNVNTSGSAHAPHKFNIAQAIKGAETIKTFDNPEMPMKVLCNVHPWMIGYVAIFDHPYFAVTDKDGNFKFPADLPAGKYNLAFKHMKIHGPSKEKEEVVEITVDGNKVVNQTLKVPAP